MEYVSLCATSSVGLPHVLDCWYSSFYSWGTPRRDDPASSPDSFLAIQIHHTIWGLVNARQHRTVMSVEGLNP